MSRQRRIDVVGGVFHVMNRGIEKRNIIADDLDRNIWWNLFERVATRCQWRVFAVALLDNHFHIYLKTPLPNLSVGMHDLDGGYASTFNQRHERAGHLFQGRFKSQFVQSDGHVWELSRYVHLNPYRAGLAGNPFQYRWCSYRFILDTRTAPTWFDWRTVLGQFGGTQAAATLAYKRFVEFGLNQRVSNPFPQWNTAGISNEKAEVRCHSTLQANATPGISLPNLDGVIVEVCEFFGCSIETLSSGRRHNNLGRDAAVLLCRDICGCSPDEIRALFGINSRSAVSEIVRRATVREQTNATFREQLQSLRRKLQP